jgi:hypothetical protein
VDSVSPAAPAPPAPPRPGAPSPEQLLDFPGQRFVAGLHGLRRRLNQRFVANYAGMVHRLSLRSKGVPSAARKNAHAALEDAFGLFRLRLPAYLDGRPDPERWMASTFFLIEGRMFDGVYRMISDFEAAMTPSRTALGATMRDVTDEEFRLLGLWRLMARVSAATVVVDALPYEEIWDRIYGDAGYWLSEQIAGFAADVRLSDAFAMLAGAARVDPWLADHVSLAAGGNGYPVGTRLAALQHEPAEWREWCARQGCRFEDQGDKKPFSFVPIPAALLGPTKSGGDHLFARPTAQARLQHVWRHWDWVRPEFLRVEGDAFHQKVNAGSLQHGGAHPPHKTHRNGAMFDVGLLRLIPPACRGPRDTRIDFAPEVVEGTPNQLDRFIRDLLERIFTVDEPEEGTKPKDKITTFCRTDFEFPPSDVKDKNDAIVDFDKAAKAFVQCLLLTFPSQILFARWATLAAAMNELVDRIDEIEASLTADGRELTQEEATTLKLLRDRLGRVPEERPEKGSAGVLFLREDHADHWHVSYAPADVETRDRDRDVALAWIAAHRDLFWDTAAER